MISHLRIHIATLGHLADRVYTPARNMKADKLYLLHFENERNEKAKIALKEIRSEAKKSNIELVEIPCKIFDIIEVVNAVKKIMQDESRHNLFLNISSGNTLSSNAFTVACLLYKNLVNSVTPYYNHYDYEKMQIEDTEIITLPAFDARLPTPDQQAILKFISQNEEGVTKKHIMSHLYPDYGSKERKEKSKLLMSVNRQIIDKLHYEWKMLTLSGKGKNSIINLNQKGKEFVKFI